MAARGGEVDWLSVIESPGGVDVGAVVEEERGYGSVSGVGGCH